MNVSRLTFTDPTNLTLPYFIYQTLQEDAEHFGYIKNGQANISGFLNVLIPRLSDYRDDLHKNFLLANNNDEALTTKIEENIYKIYFNKYNYCDDGTTTVPFRVNKEHLQEFLELYDNKLPKYHMDFTGFVRSLLIEYSSKRLNQREYLFYYRDIDRINKASEKGLLCHFYTEVERSSFMPISIEVSDNTEASLIVGYNTDEELAYVLPLAYVKKIIITDIVQSIKEEHCEFVYNTLEEYCEKIEGAEE